MVISRLAAFAALAIGGLAFAGVSTPTAVASTPAPVGATGAIAAPGAPISVREANNPTGVINIGGFDYYLPADLISSGCSQGPTGTLRTESGETIEVMLTAGHCLQSFEGESELGDTVYVPLPSGETRIGERDEIGPLQLPSADEQNVLVAVNDSFNSHDWATVRLDEGVNASRVSDSRDRAGRQLGQPVVLTGVQDFRTIGDMEISFDNVGQPICKDGMMSGRSCGTQIARTNHGIWSWGLSYAKGDSGGINYNPDTKQVVGVTSQGLGPLGRAQPADRALEQAYGIPDGQVNEYFSLAESTEQHAEFRPWNEREARTNELLSVQNIEANMAEQAAQRQAAFVEAQQNAQNAAIETVDSANQLGNQARDAVINGDIAQLETTFNDAQKLAQEAQGKFDYHTNELVETGFNAYFPE